MLRGFLFIGKNPLAHGEDLAQSSVDCADFLPGILFRLFVVHLGCVDILIFRTRNTGDTITESLTGNGERQKEAESNICKENKRCCSCIF